MSHIKKNSARYNHKCKYAFMCRLFVSGFNETLFHLDFRNILKFQISSKLVQWDPNCWHADRRTGITQLTVAFSNFASAPKMFWLDFVRLTTQHDVITFFWHPNTFSCLACITWTLTSVRSSPLTPLGGAWRIRVRLSWKCPGDTSNSVHGAWPRTWTSTSVDARQSTFWGPRCTFLDPHSCTRPRPPGPCVPASWQISWALATLRAQSTQYVRRADWGSARLLGQFVGWFFNDAVSMNLFWVQHNAGYQVESQPGTRVTIKWTLARPVAKWWTISDTTNVSKTEVSAINVSSLACPNASSFLYVHIRPCT